MLDCLTIDGPEYGPSGPKIFKWWIGGKDLLQLAQYAIDGIVTSGSVAHGDGTWDKPWKLDGQTKTWIQLAKTLRSYTGTERYFWICGRFVKKAGGYYMVDGGGDDDSLGGYEPWNKKTPREGFDRGGPSYRNFANRLKAIHTDSTKSLSMEAWSAEKAAKLCKVLMADPEYMNKLRYKGHWTTGQVLPVLAATMFLAEPARNIRCFLINKMLLDMMITGMTYGGRKPGSSPKQYRLDTLLLRDPQEKGGKMPAAMAGSAKAASPIAPSPTKLGQGAYTQAKELTILCHYLNWGNFQGTNESLVDKRTYQQLRILGDPPVHKEWSYADPVKTAGYLKYLMQQVLHSFTP